MLSSIVSLALALGSITGALAASTPPSGAITIGGTLGKYKTITLGLADTSSSVYFIYAGTYNEQVYITRANIKIYGETTQPKTYLGNKVLITAGVPASTAGSNDKSGTVRIGAANVALYNINITNSYGHPVSASQAIALSVAYTQFGGYGLKLTGYQDTLLANVGDEFFSQSLIQGAVDFIFGRSGSLWITKSVIESVGTGWLTASGRESADAHYYVIDSSTIIGSGSATTFLGRPWGAYARVVFQNSNLSNAVKAAGWSIWNTGDERTDHVTFAEYNNSGAGASGTRASFSSKLTKAIAIGDVLSSTSWIDSTFL